MTYPDDVKRLILTIVSRVRPICVKHIINSDHLKKFKIALKSIL